MKTKIKNAHVALKKWDEKHTNFHPATYMLIFLTASAEAAMLMGQASAAL